MTISLPENIKMRDLYDACIVLISLKASVEKFNKKIHKAHIIAIVLNAIIRFKSVSVLFIIKLANKLVMIIKLIQLLYSNIKYLAKVQQPTITKVQECSKDDTGVGPSIASVNHNAVKAFIDFIETAINKTMLNTL